MKVDNQGRQFIAMHDVRSGIYSASATLSNGTATSLIAADSDYFTDIIEISGANSSDAAITVTLTNDGTTVRSLRFPANDTTLLKFDVPTKQNTKNTPWFADMGDFTNTSITIDALFIKK